MASYDFRAPRLFVDVPLPGAGGVALDKTQANYLGNVLRLGVGAAVLVFNGRDGEWRAEIAEIGRKGMTLSLVGRTRPQPPAADLHYLFAPLKHARLDYMVQKAVEMGASRLAPVITRRTQASRVNLERMRANAIEAAEQCGILALPEVAEERRLPEAVALLEPERLLVFCDEEADVADPVEALSRLREEARRNGTGAMPLALLIGPEGGFDAAERALLAARPNVLRLSLGPRILRADTAAVAALAVLQAVLGDWRGA
ncbi:16S rRNA (uracil(1498)-N(3))-methyltransferase [Chelatococcus sp. SYSU_G07232]|uniref:Ribosomal RNA small subunit methyltransferase E n=1 Tax=Chelatococcus albus TaxID=3047466 RepID=A0ABT7AKX3_9HYPH|nr:16S rRNA (uracil(1498)-N(3))-methyltransferase [Chelatococcus sp. SYSU_G07232]MDJ1160022.1 16S rRNA (uracil(1498)-N(3))-methyltransferase [Chelatococcus sp. SYSU_G07232]